MEPEQLVLDELHALLQISDVLLRNLIFQADSIDQRVRVRRENPTALKALEAKIRSCVSFTIRQVILNSSVQGTHIFNSFITIQAQDENKRPVSGVFEWTALDRRQKLKVLRALPDKLGDLFPEDVPRIGTLWKVR